MRRNMDDVEPLRGKQHPRRRAAGQMREQSGVAVVMMPRRIERFLVDRGGDDAGGLPRLRQFDGGTDILIRRLAAARAQNAETVRQSFDRYRNEPERLGIMSRLFGNADIQPAG